jgi:hypothetical protein
MSALKEKNDNVEVVEGRIYQHDLEVKAVKNQNSPNFGKPFIGGTIDVATDDAGLNIVKVHYPYVAQFTKEGKTSNIYTSLKKIIDTGKTIIADGKDAATLVRLQPSAKLNEFYPSSDLENLVSSPRNEGGFVNFVKELKDESQRSKFTFDMVITKVVHVDEEDGNGYSKINGAIFGYKNTLLPFTVVARHPEAMNYFEGLEASNSNPIYCNLWGKIVTKTISQPKVKESVFACDEASVDEKTQYIREWVVTGAKPTYDYDPEALISEISKLMTDRNLMLAEKKKESQERNANSGVASATAAIPSGGFNF